MAKRLVIKNKSMSFSFEGWQLWKFIKGRKKTAITVVGFLLGYLISDSEVIGLVSAGLVEMGFAITEYYVKNYNGNK